MSLRTAFRLGLVRSGVGVLLIAALACSEESGDPVRQETARVESVPIEDSILSAGSVKPDVGGQIRVGPRISGRLKRLHVKEGDRVREGQLVAEIEDDELRSRLLEAAAARREGEITVEGAGVKFERRRRLAAEGLLSEDEADGARIEWERSKAALERLEGSERRARVELGYTRLFAPLSGVVTRVSTQEGETVASSFETPTFLTILDPSQLMIEALVDEVDIGRIALGQTARITLDALPGAAWSGRVRSIGREPTESTGPVRFAVVVDLAAGDRAQLRPRLTATVEFIQNEARSALTVPVSAIRQDGAGYFVMVEGTGGGLVRRAILPGTAHEDRIAVTGEISAGETVQLHSERQE